MKLYATTTSERATKGQGGKWLDIIIYNDKKQAGITIKAILDVSGRIRANIFTDMRFAIIDNNSGFIEEQKGKKQKGDKVVHKCYIEHTSGQYKGLSVPHYHE